MDITKSVFEKFHWAAAFIFAATLMTVLNPPFQAPDEPTHLAKALTHLNIQDTNSEDIEKNILDILPRYQFWKLVRFPLPDPPVDRFYEAPLLKIVPTQKTKPLLYFKISSLILSSFKVVDPISGLYCLRFFGLALSLISFFIFYAIVHACISSLYIRVLAIALVATPQYLYMAGAANPATLSWISGGLIVLGSIHLLNKQIRYRSWLYLAAGCMLIPFSHRAGLTVLGAPVAAVLFRVYTQHQPVEKSLTRIWLPYSIAGGCILTGWIAMAIFEPLIIRKGIITFYQIIRQLNIPFSSQSTDIEWWKQFGCHFHKSLWLSFGWLKIHAPSWVYYIFMTYYIFPVIGLIRFMFRRKQTDQYPSKRMVWVLVIAAMGAIYGGAVMYALSSKLSQGRYLFPAWPAFAVLWAVGWMNIVPDKLRTHMAYLIAGITWAIAIYAVWGVLIPEFYF